MPGASTRGPVTRSERVRTLALLAPRRIPTAAFARRALRPTDTITCRCFSRRRCRDEGATSVFFSPRAIRASERFLIDAVPRDSAGNKVIGTSSRFPPTLFTSLCVLLDHLQAAKMLDNLSLCSPPRLLALFPSFLPRRLSSVVGFFVCLPFLASSSRLIFSFRFVRFFVLSVSPFPENKA